VGQRGTRPVTLIAEDALAQMKDFSQQALPYETGGVLVGVVTTRGPWITQVVELPSDSLSRNRFLIPEGATHVALSRCQSIDGRLGYLGDWHSHPHDVGASTLDAATLATLAKDAFRHRRRLLAVMRFTGENWRLEVRSHGRLRAPVMCRAILTGPLGASTRAAVGSGWPGASPELIDGVPPKPRHHSGALGRSWQSSQCES
jgi:hypothetical protein